MRTLLRLPSCLLRPLVWLTVCWALTPAWAQTGTNTPPATSKDERPRHCRVDTRGGVRLVDQRSRAPCIRGRSWGVDRGGIWVAHGCRARFEVGGGYGGRPDYGYGPGYGGGYGQGPVVVRCESHDNRPRFCAVDGRIRDVRIQRQLSRSRCDYGYSWGFQRNGIWVENGCRAEFVVY